MAQGYKQVRGWETKESGERQLVRSEESPAILSFSLSPEATPTPTPNHIQGTPKPVTMPPEGGSSLPMNCWGKELLSGHGTVKDEAEQAGGETEWESGCYG